MNSSDIALFLHLPSTPTEAGLLQWELFFICCVLIGIFLVLSFLAVCFFKMIKAMNQMGNQVEGQDGERQLREKIEDLLATGKVVDAKRIAEEWVATRPGSIQARWLLAQSNYHVGELIDAKKGFLEVRELAPNWEVSITPWLDRVEDKISSSGPKVIK